MSRKIIVTVSEGKIKGTKTKSKFSEVEFYSFYGVPYGNSTAKHARFQDPVEAKPWKNILDAATQKKQGCCQYAPNFQSYTGSEDCLYNNIHTLRLPSEGDTLRPVVFYIHPGSFYFGSPETWYFGSPDYVMHHDIVYVCVAFRLHILGFLNLGLKECSGNQGLKDIMLSLKWIKKNVASFGGDPDNVTLIGGSSGALLIHFLMLSPAAKGLFHKAVIMGGCVFNIALHSFEENASTAFEVARKLGYDGTDVNDKKKLLHFYKRLNPHIIALRPETKGIPGPYARSQFGPTIDAGDNAVLPVPYAELIESTARVPLIIGMCEREGVMGFSKAHKKTLMENFKSLLRLNRLGWTGDISDTNLDALYEETKLFYLDGNSIETAPLSVLVDILTDAGFSDIYDTLVNVISADLSSSVFVYKFQYESTGEVKTMKDQVGHLYEPMDGTFHGTEISYWACVKEGEVDLTDRTRNMIETFTKLFTHFAETGNPNNENSSITWQPSTPEKHCYLSINDPLNLVQGKLTGERMEFWQRLKEKYGKQ